MWGDSERAITMDSSDPLAAVLFQITGPAHIPWQDPRWQELLHGYNVWVHLEFVHDAVTNSTLSQLPSMNVIHQACQSLLQHAPRTSNLAALAMHVTRMLREVLPTHDTNPTSTTTTGADDSSAGRENDNNGGSTFDLGAVEHFSNRIALVGKARAVAGALNLLRILCHAVLVQTASLNQKQTQDNAPLSVEDYLPQIFTYQSRDHHHHNKPIDTASDLLSALCQFLVSPMLLRGTHDHDVPELYDTTVQCLQLLLVLFSSQLYQPMISSFQLQQISRSRVPNDVTTTRNHPHVHLFWTKFWTKALDKSSRQSRYSSSSHPQHNNYRHGWTPQRLVLRCLEWHMERPNAPIKSIAHHLAQLAQSVVRAKGERMASDGMYENHQVVQAAAPRPSSEPHSHGHVPSNGGPAMPTALARRGSSSSQLILDATKGVLVLSGALILLPWRLVSLAFSLWGNGSKDEKDRFDKNVKQQLAAHIGVSSTHAGTHRTKDALWLSDSMVADLSTCLLLLLVNNYRATSRNDDSDDPNSPMSDNPFRQALASLSDNRWEGTDSSALPDLPDFMDPNKNNNSEEEQQEEEQPLISSPTAQNGFPSSTATSVTGDHCLVNFESLFESFSRVTHTELGALLLYTLLQASRSFAESVAVRSDLDTLVLPLLRTMYFASSSRYFLGHDAPLKSSNDNNNNNNNNKSNKLSIRNCPFRSPSQLYVIIILLLLFSQDASFGADAFRRIRIPKVEFYKERNLKDISLGSLLILSLLRSLTFNLNRLSDLFLLSNCCAILMNLSRSVTDLHDYTSMRLVSVCISTMKKYSALHKENPAAAKEDATSEASMYSEVSRTLLRVLRQCLDSKCIEGNLNLVYALVYHSTDLARVLSMEESPFRSSEVRLVDAVAKAGTAIVEDNGARAAAVALKVLKENMDSVRETSVMASNGSHHKQLHHDGRKSSRSNGGGGGRGSEDFMFTYEEEADPESFFVPYCWEVIVCSVTAGSIGWRKRSIAVFALLDEAEEAAEDYHYDGQQDLPEVVAQGFANDVSDVV